MVLFTGLAVDAHVALWVSPDMPEGVTLRLTVMNSLAMAVILLPAILVGIRLRADLARC